jgi:F-type H+-transporting ATPase subunit b
MPTIADLNVVLLAAEEGGAGEGGGGNNFLIPNGTFFVVLLIFLIVLGVIGKWVVPPISKVLGERDAMVKQTVEDSRKAAEQFAAADKDYQAEMAKARGEASKLRDEARAEGRKVLEDMRSRASDEVSSTLQQADSELKEQALSIQPGLRSSVDTLSASLASRVLGVDITSATTASGR